jgi:hypothetical protein
VGTTWPVLRPLALELGARFVADGILAGLDEGLLQLALSNHLYTENHYRRNKYK